MSQTIFYIYNKRLKDIH